MCAKSFVFHTARSSGALGNDSLGAVEGAFMSIVQEKEWYACVFITYTEDKALDSTLSSLYRAPGTRHQQWTHAPCAAATVVCRSPRAPGIAAAFPRCP